MDCKGGKQIRALELDSYRVFGLYEPALVSLGGYVVKLDVVRQRSEEWNALSDEHGHASYDQAVNQPLAQKPLHTSLIAEHLGLGDLESHGTVECSTNSAARRPARCRTRNRITLSIVGDA